MKKRILSVAIIATMLCSLLVVPASAKAFPDAGGHWAQEAINVWSDRGVVNGDDAGNFRPGDPITRAETAKLIDNLIGFQKTSNKVFSDVDKNAWYADSVNKLYASNVMTGYEDGTIRPGNRISRQEAAVIIARAFGLETKKVDLGILAGFADNDQIQDWAKPVIAYMAGLAFVQGSDGMFRPGDPITRAEVVTILNNMVGIYADGSQSTYTGNYGDKIAIVKAPTIFNGVTLGGAVVCGTTKGKVNFNSGSKVSGCVCNWAPNASVSTAGATVAATANKGGGTISAGGNFGAMSGPTGAASGGSAGGGISGGGISGGGSAGSSASAQHSVTYYSNGGVWDINTTQQTIVYNNGNSYALRLPINPSRTGYTFEGWYKSIVAANALDSAQKLDPYDIVGTHTPKVFYAGWKKPVGLYGTVSVATGDNVANRGKSANELMDGVTLTATAGIDSYQATGGLRYVTGYTLSPTLSTEGNFLALTYTLPGNLINPSAVTLTSGFSDDSAKSIYNTFTAQNSTYTRVFEIDAAALSKDILFKVDLDGSGLNTSTIVVDLSGLLRYQFATATTAEDFTAAASNPAIEKITLNAPITLASGTYGSATNKKELVLNAPISIAKAANVTLRNMNITADASVPVLFANTTEIPEGETEAVTTKAEALTLDSLSISAAGILNGLSVKNLVIKNTAMVYAGDSTATALSLAAPVEGDTVSITNTTVNGYHVGLETQDAALFDGVAFKNNIFKNNTTDIQLGVAAAVPNLSYNYFDGEPVIAGTEGAVSTFVGPLYTAETMQSTDLAENLHDAYVYVDGVYAGKLSAISNLALTFVTEETPCEITLTPADARNTAVTINNEVKSSVTVLKSELPADLTIQVGAGPVKTLSLAVAVAVE